MGGAASKPIQYATPISEPREGETAIYRSPPNKDELISTVKTGAQSLQEVFLSNFKSEPTRQFLGYRKLTGKLVNMKMQRFDATLENKFTYFTNSEIEEQVKALGSAIFTMGLAPERKQYRDYSLRFIGIHSKNSKEWIITDINYVSMPLYDTLGEEAIDHMLEETQLTTIFLTADLIKKHAKRIRDARTSGKKIYLETLVVMDEDMITEQDRKELEGIKHFTFSQLLEEGRKIKLDFPKVKPEDITCFSYTSGTTGAPKGAMLSNRNLLSMMGGGEVRISMITSNSVYLSYLPLAHIFEKVMFLFMVYQRATYNIYNGDVLKIKEDIAILRPTFFASVPRMFNKVHDTIKAKLGELSGCKASLARKAVETKERNVTEDGKLTHMVYDALVFKKVKEVLGGRLEVMLTASAPLSLPVKRFLKICFGCPFLEGYGQTEGTGGEFVTDPSDKRMDTVGGPVPMNEFKLIDVPEMKYYSTDKDEDGQPAPRGEICVRGHNVIPGYYKNDEKNKETFDSEGWLHSGDIGIILPGTNALKVIDRRKNIFKLSQGEYVAPDKLEQVYKTTSGIADIFVYGDSFKSALVGIVNLDEAAALKAAREASIQAASVAELASNPAYNKLLIDMLRTTADKNQLKGFERIVRVRIDPKPFAEYDLLTTTFKLKRAEAKTAFKEVIDDLYKGLD